MLQLAACMKGLCLTTNVTKSGTICLHGCTTGRGFISLCKESGNKACLILPLQPAGKGNINVSSLLKAMTQILLTIDQFLNQASTVCLDPICHFWLGKKYLTFFITIIPSKPIREVAFIFLGIIPNNVLRKYLRRLNK